MMDDIERRAGLHVVTEETRLDASGVVTEGLKVSTRLML